MLDLCYNHVTTMLVTNLTNITCYKNPQNVSIHLRFVWQAWHLVTSTFVLRGRSGAYLGMALDWLWWRAWARLGALGRRGRRGTLRGRRGTW